MKETMQYWWVNQKQTYRQEIGEGYMWSPKRKKDGRKHFSYEYIKHVQPGDVVFSYAKAAIIAVGVVSTNCYSFPKPAEFGKVGTNWSYEGWKVDVRYRKLEKGLRTMDHIEYLRSFLPRTKSPIRHVDGGGNQSYLFLIDKQLAIALASLIDGHTVALVSGDYISDYSDSAGSIDTNIIAWENRIENEIRDSSDLTETSKETLIKARRGQGKFRELLLVREPRCRITGVDKPQHLIASHIKPWRSATNDERLDPENGFMLTPTIDHLFDRGFIGFGNDGSVILADVANRAAMKKMGVVGGSAPRKIGAITDNQKMYLDWHRESILLS